MIIYNFPANTILMSGTRRVSGTDVKANRSISIRFSEELFDKINAQWKKDGFVYKPYFGCEGFKRTCTNTPLPGKMYCKKCLDNMNNHIFS